MDLYFDNAATTRISENALAAYAYASITYPANPSSVHKAGLEAKRKLEEERARIASLMGTRPESLFFTSGATESIAAVLSSLLLPTPGKVIISSIEHEAVSSWLPALREHGWKAAVLRARNGFVSPEDLRAELTPDTKAVAVMSVNNVTGAIQPIPELVRTVREYEKEGKRHILFFSDSVQALGKVDFPLEGSGVDAASFSGHKINGPRGIGMLYLRQPQSFRPLAPAGGQERGKRGGTENLPAISALRAAVEEWLPDAEANRKRIGRIREKCINALRSMGLRILSPEASSPYIISFASPLPSEVFTRMLSDRGVMASSGSACSNNARGEGERILLGMGIKPQDAARAVRISFSKDTSEEAADELIRIMEETVNGR